MSAMNSSDPRPIYEQVKETLQEQIRDGRLGLGQRVPDERSLAKQLNVSRTTVRRAIAGLAAQGTMTRVRGRGTFVSASRPREQDSARSATLAIVMPPGQIGAGQSLFYHRILNGLHEAAEPRGHALLMRKVTSPFTELAAHLNASGQVAGVVVLGIADPEILNALRRVSAPMVLVDSGPLPQGMRWDSITHDAEDGAYHAVTYLLQLGHREIGLMNYVPETNASVQRQRGYERALADFGVAVRPERVLRTSLNVMSAYATMRHAFSQGVKFTAALCTSDELAIGVMTAARDHGLSIPVDFSVVGFGDLGHMVVPALSSVRIPLEQMGAKAVDLLEQRRREPDRSSRTVVFPAEFVARGSCDCPRVVSEGTDKTV